MICLTCKERAVEVHSTENEDVTVRTYECSCGRFHTIEITEDRYEALKSSLGGLYGAMKRLKE